MTKTIGLVGLGNMGAALAGRLVQRFTVVGFDPSESRREAAHSIGVRTTETVQETFAAADVLILSLPHPRISRSTIDALVASGPAKDLFVIETSTILPEDAREAARVCQEARLSYVDAAILSGVQSVLEGTTTLLVGGTREGLAPVADVLDAITTSHVPLGNVGAGMAAKVINNLVAHDVYVVLSEAVALGRANGVPVDTLVNILSGPEAGLMRPLTHRIGQRLVDRDFEGGMPVDAATKDSQLALLMAQADHVPLYATQAAHTVYETAVRRGWGRLDYSVIATLWDEADTAASR